MNATLSTFIAFLAAVGFAGAADVGGAKAVNKDCLACGGKVDSAKAQVLDVDGVAIAVHGQQCADRIKADPKAYAAKAHELETKAKAEAKR